jgi:DNA-binding NarL/FixJ family response regulator
MFLADSHATMRRGVQRFLETTRDFGIVDAASDGPEAVTCVRAHLPDILLLEIPLSGMNGKSLSTS